MFHDPQAKVFSLFLEVLVDFINFHAEDLEEWIPICLNRLLTKVGADLLGSVQIKVQRALKTIRSVSVQFDHCDALPIVRHEDFPVQLSRKSRAGKNQWRFYIGARGG